MLGHIWSRLPVLIDDNRIPDDYQHSQNIIGTLLGTFILNSLILYRHESTFSRPLPHLVTKRPIRLDYQVVVANTNGDYKLQTKKFSVPFGED